MPKSNDFPGGEVVGQVVINVDGTIVKRWGVDSVTKVAAGHFRVTWNANLGLPIQADRQIVWDLRLPTATLPTVTTAHWVVGVNSTSDDVVVVNAAGAALVDPPAGSLLTVTCIRSGLPA